MIVTKLISFDAFVGDYVAWKDDEATADACSIVNARGIVMKAAKVGEPAPIQILKPNAHTLTVAFMPRCNSCRHWSKHNDVMPPFVCWLLTQNHVTGALDDTYVETPPDFGCVKWEAK